MIDIIAPFEQEGTKAIVRSWLRKPGERIALNDPLVELETDKVTQEVPAPADGVLEEILLDTDAEAVPGALLGRMRALSDSAPAEPAGERPAVEPRPDREMRLSPAVRRAVRQHGIDPSGIVGSGRDGRITRADVDRLVAERAAAPAVARSEPAPAPSGGKAKVIPHDRMRLAIAENMLNSVTTAPHVTAVFEADFSAILAHRARQKTTGEAVTITA
ncbi:MAG TPA: E3 binding domain-containing protein [Sphingomonas sp.]|nr:E3 binding domain-containing protein [Sphingomonas sp.]